MGNEFVVVNGVKINKDDFKRTYKEDGKEFVELKNGVKINIWNSYNGEGYIKIDKDNKTQIGNILSGDIIGTNGNDNIEINNSRFMGHIDLKGGNDKITTDDVFTRDVIGGDGNDTATFNNTRTIGKVNVENVTYINNSTAHGGVLADNVLFKNSSHGFNVEAKKERYVNQFPTGR